jgi:hypothetical protein
VKDIQTKAPEADVSAWLAALNWWGPIMSAQTAYNAKAHEIFRQLSNEWQSFVAQRTREDQNVMHQMASAKSPVQVLEITARFWQKAADDYAREYTAVVKLAGNCVMSAVDEAQHSGKEASRPTRTVDAVPAPGNKVFTMAESA